MLDHAGKDISRFVMKFSDAIANVAKLNDLRRIARARLFDVSRLEEEELRREVIAKEKHYSDFETLAEALKTAVHHKDRDTRTIAPLLLGEVLLQEHGHALPQKEVEDRIVDWEQAIINESNESSQRPSRQIHNFEFFRFVLEAAWENNNDISPDEKNLIERIRTRLSITEKEYRLVEAQLGHFPKAGNEIHTRDEINKVRHYLQENGLLITFRDSEGRDQDVIPEEMAAGLRVAFGLECRRYGYQKLIAHKGVRNKGYLEGVLRKSEISLSGALNLPDLQELCVEHVSPCVVLGGFSPRDGLEVAQLEKWCRELGLAVSGSKKELIDRVIQHYDGLIETATESADEREPWFAYYEEFANRNYSFLRSQDLIEKDQDVDKRFEYATDYLFEQMLRHKPLDLPGSEQPDGALSLGDGLLLWDNKSKESECNLRHHLAQFDRYFVKAEKKAAALVVIAPAFTSDSDAQAKLHEVQTGHKLSLITAAELKELAVQWASSKKSDDAFPLRYLTTTGRFDPSILVAVL
jgi:hypothetical protein